MMYLHIIGNLGADAEQKKVNGHAFVSFRVACSDRNRDGQEVTQWVSCALSGDGGNVAQYLVKGQKVFCMGRPRFRAYSSSSAHAFVAGVDLFVDRVVLCGSPIQNQTNNEDSDKPF